GGGQQPPLDALELLLTARRHLDALGHLLIALHHPRHIAQCAGRNNRPDSLGELRHTSAGALRGLPALVEAPVELVNTRFGGVAGADQLAGFDIDFVIDAPEVLTGHRWALRLE